VKIISHDAHMDAFTYRHAELACEALSLSTTADAIQPLAHVFVQASDDNHPPPAGGLVDGDRHAVVRRRETSEDLVAREEMS